MKIRIDRYGQLCIERVGAMKQQSCPGPAHDHAPGGGQFCGDWCPLFGEPESRLNETGQRYDQSLKICGGRTLYGQMEDQRKAPTPPAPSGG